MRIGVIDTGVDRTHRRFAGASLGGVALRRDPQGTIVADPEEVYNDELLHGTGIVSIILQHNPRASIYVVKLTPDGGRVPEDLLTAAITHLVRQTDVGIINISMGVKTRNPGLELQQICEEAAAKDIVINAAAWYVHHELCYPAGFSAVYGIGQGVVKDKSSFRLQDNRVTDILAKGGFQRVACPGNQFRFSNGTSLATAHFTGIIAAAFAAGEWDTRFTLTQWLRDHSDNTILSLTRHDQQYDKKAIREEKPTDDQLYARLRPSQDRQRIAIFPFEEKEMKSLLEFSDLLSFDLGLAIGYPRVIKTNQALDLIREKGLPYTLQQLTEEEYDRFDTLVVGYFLDKLSDYNSIYGLNLLRDCIRRNKNFIVWDKAVYDILQTIKNEVNPDYSAEIFFTSFDQEKQDMLYSSQEYTELKVPSLCVIGTNSRQGKFTTQLTIKKIMEQHGYAVSHLSTEPQGILLGADLTFPIGHKNTVYVDVRDWHKTLRLLQQILERKNKPDLIVTGSQGGILPLHPINDSGAPEKLCYVKAFYPDALVCTISPYDELDFIKRTTDVITSFVDTRVLFYVLTPWQYEFHHGKQSIVSFKKIGDDEYQERLAFYNRHLQLPTVNIVNTEEHPRILRLIQDNFSTN